MDDFNISPLFNSTSMSPPKLGAPPAAALPQASADALASALLLGILAELSALKEALEAQSAFNRHANDFVQQQLASSAVQNDLNTSVGRHMVRFADLVDHVARIEGVVADLDRRLAALDGKHSMQPRDSEPAA